MKTYPQQHTCTDKTIYKWEARKERPVSCPRCKQRLDKPNQKKSE